MGYVRAFLAGSSIDRFKWISNRIKRPVAKVEEMVGSFTAFDTVARPSLYPFPNVGKADTEQQTAGKRKQPGGCNQPNAASC